MNRCCGGYDQNLEDEKSFDNLDDVWSLSACNFDPLPATRRSDYEDLEPIDEAAFDWEPPELKSLDWNANLDALSISMALPMNKEWDRIETIYIKDPVLRQWAKEILLESSIEVSQNLTEEQRTKFLELFKKIPRDNLKHLSFLNPVSVIGSVEEPEVENSSDSQEMDGDDSESSVYL